MHRVLDSRLGILERQCKSDEHQGSKPIQLLTLGGRLLYPKTVSAGVAHVLRRRTASRMRTFISSLDVDENTSLNLTISSPFQVALRMRTVLRMRTFILALDVDEDGSPRLTTGAYYGAVYRCYYHRMDLFNVTSL